MLVPGQTLPLTIEKPAAGGRMIARLDGQVVLVSGAIPGERVRVRVERVSKGVAFAETIAVEQASADRRDPAGDLLCGGTLLAHVAYPRQLDIKSAVVADAFARIGHVALPGPVPVAPSPEEGYRMRARLHVRGGRIGFFREGTHDLCDPRQTRQLLPASCDVLDRLAAALRSVRADAVKEVELAENVDASQRVVALETAAPLDSRVIGRLDGTVGLTGLTAGGIGFGDLQVIDSLPVGDGRVVSLARDVRAFFQGNRYLLSPFVTHVIAQVPAGGHLLDLYAGVGLFAIPAALTTGARVTAVEGDAVTEAALHRNAATSGANVAAVHEPVESYVVRLPQGSGGAVIVDPPRTGMSRDALEGVLKVAAARLIYVSCDVATLARDTRRIVDAGYAITRADAFDMFPNTPHVETVVVFDRGG